MLENEVLNIKNWLVPTDVIFRNFSRFVLDKKKPLKRRIFIDRGSDICMMAHADTVQQPKLISYSANNDKIYASGLDDRLGCLTAATLSHHMKCDLIITDLEESGRTTIAHHKSEKDYNWVVEFDRKGDDVVTYRQDSKEWLEALKEFFKVGHGSFSDIARFDIPCCKMNVGIGYEGAHIVNSHFKVGVYLEQIEKFLDFYSKYKKEEFLIDKDSHKCGYGFQNRNFTPTDTDKNDDFGDEYTEDYMWLQEDQELDNSEPLSESSTELLCGVCGMVKGDEVHGVRVCENCFYDLLANYDPFTFENFAR
jgi:hypothetical protein